MTPSLFLDIGYPTSLVGGLSPVCLVGEGMGRLPAGKFFPTVITEFYLPLCRSLIFQHLSHQLRL